MTNPENEAPHSSSVRRETPPSREIEVSLLRYLFVVLKRAHVVVRFVGLVVVVAVAWTIREPARYTSETTFVLSSRRSATANLNSVAAQLGLSGGPTGDWTQSPQALADLAVSRTVLDRVAARRFAVTAGVESLKPLAEILGVSHLAEEQQRQALRTELAEMISVEVAARTGTIRLQVQDRRAALAYGLVISLVEELGRWCVDLRRAQAVSERSFAEARLADARQELELAEEALRTFVDSNRQFERSPGLLVKQQRLQREQLLRQGTYTALAQNVEQLRIEEARDTPFLTVLDPPEQRVRPDRTKWMRLLLVAILLGAFGGIVTVFLLEYVEIQRSTNAPLFSAVEAKLSEMRLSIRARTVFNRRRGESK